MAAESSHDALAAELRTRVLTTGVVSEDLRAGAMDIGAGGAPSLPDPYDMIARQICDASYRVTDEQVASVREVAGSDRAAFEVIMSASIGAGLQRWDAASRAIQEATDAAS